jgi:hypothetical protein
MPKFYIPETREEFIEILKEIICGTGLIKEEEAKINSVPHKKNVLSRKDTAKYLNISLPTLDNLTQEGFIKASRLKSRVLYEMEDILDALKNSKNIKNKK